MSEPSAVLTVEPLLYEVTVTLGQSVPESRLLPVGPYADGLVLTVLDGAPQFAEAQTLPIDGGTFN